MTDVRLSKFLSLMLRHKPQTIGLTLDAQGWAEVDDLIAKMAQAGTSVSREQLEHVVATSDKKRFAFSEDGVYIRANQGHSLEIDLGLEPRTPPDRLYHGTATRFLDAILQEGLVKGSRQHVHLSGDEATALQVGRRHGKPVVLSVEAGRMHEDRYMFYRSSNGVWLSEHVPAHYLKQVLSLNGSR